MNYEHLEKEINHIYPSIKLDKFLNLKVQAVLRMTIFFFIALLLFLLYLNPIINLVNISNINLNYLESLIFILLGFYAILMSISFYHNSFYFSDIKQPINNLSHNSFKPGSFILANILFESKNNIKNFVYKTNKDLTETFLNSEAGREFVDRLNINKEEVKLFLVNKKNSVTKDNIEIKIEGDNILVDYVLSLYGQDREFADFLFRHQIQKEQVSGTINWIFSNRNKQKRKDRWWSKENLDIGKGIGAEWSYGQTYTIEKYGSRIEDAYNFDDAYLSKETESKILQIENILEKDKQRNVLLVGDNQVLNINMVEFLSKKIIRNDVLKTLKDKNIFVIDTDVLVASTKNKNEFEIELFNILNQTIKAGNVILFIPNLPVFINNAKNLGSDISSLIEPYITNTQIQIIATSPIGTFHQFIEKDNILMTGFEKVMINEESYSSLLEILLQEAIKLEKEYGVLFTYQSVETLAKDSSRFFVGELIIDKTVDILEELPLLSIKNQDYIITKELVEKLIYQKTNVPTGKIDNEEKNKLLNLESELHKYIVGQDEAVKAIVSTIKRLRAEVNTSNRPIGSFLFLGPTGVGKTETVKSLCKVFFGESGNIIRLDMSEYHGDEGLEKLIGSFKTNSDGYLVNKLRENQYGILLLDEFEKASSDVLNLFLQIIDEGVFSDMNGKKVNARNMIIIATSNAGSEMIWEISQKGEDLNSNKDKIIDSIIKNGIFKPELINRFDSAILFHSLKTEHLRKIADIAIIKLKKEMRDKGFNVNFSEDITDFLVEKGLDPKFGARPLRRAIQDSIEKAIAEKIIDGSIQAGDTFTLSRKNVE